MATERAPYGDPTYDRTGEGWLVFASVVLVIVGMFNLILGITLVAEDEIYVSGPERAVVLVADVTTWGWVILVVGALEIVAGFGVLGRNQLARWFAIAMASLGALAQLPVIFGPKPLFSFLIVLICVFVIYGLAAYGGRDRAAI